MLDVIAHTLLRLWLFDVEQFSHPWMYEWILIPAMGYFVFFMCKWTVLTAPLWLPITVICQALGSIFQRRCYKDVEEE